MNLICFKYCSCIYLFIFTWQWPNFQVKTQVFLCRVREINVNWLFYLYLVLCIFKKTIKPRFKLIHLYKDWLKDLGLAKRVRNRSFWHLHPKFPLNFNIGKSVRQRRNTGKKKKKKDIYTCKCSHIKQDKQGEGSAVKWFGINLNLLRLGTVLEVITQDSKEAMGWIKWKSDVYVLLLCSLGSLLFVRFNLC